MRIDLLEHGGTCLRLGGLEDCAFEVGLATRYIVSDKTKQGVITKGVFSLQTSLEFLNSTLSRRWSNASYFSTLLGLSRSSRISIVRSVESLESRLFEEISFVFNRPLLPTPTF